MAQMNSFFYKGKHKKQWEKIVIRGESDAAEYEGGTVLYHSPAEEAVIFEKLLSLSGEKSRLKRKSASISMAQCLPSAIKVHLLLACVLSCLYNGTVEIIHLWIRKR